jgi:uncharacterized membrane protein YraQ (UPF0718 family)
LGQELYIFATTATAIFLEAAPFLLLGALASSLIEVYFPGDGIGKWVPKGLPAGVAFGLGGGLLIPTCECGVVPIVRRFLIKGVPPHVAITFMLAAPVINPLVLVSTYVAFRGNIWMVLGRVALVAVPAACMGLALSRSHPHPLLQQQQPDHTVDEHSDCHFQVVHQSQKGSRLIAVLAHTASEFLEMGKYLILGCFAAGFLKTFLSDNILTVFETNTFLAVGAMMLLAMVLSVCSEADSFVAASLRSFPAAAQLSFVAIGPMVDLKLLFMYNGIFRRRVVLALVTVPTVIIYISSVILGMIFG